MSAAVFVAARNTCDNDLSRAARLQVAILIGKSDDGICVPDIDVLGSRARRIKSNPVGHGQAVGKYRVVFNLAIAGEPAKYVNAACVALGRK